VTKIFPGADVYEREIREMFGIEFNGMNYENLLLPDGFPEGLYPLRKNYTVQDIHFDLDTAKARFELPEPLPEDTRFSIAVGPQHPTHKEPIRFQFFVTGENIDDVALRLGFNHRGIEKALEVGDWNKNLYLIERICGICSAAHQLAYTITAEKVANIEDEIPDRAQWIRCLIAELERIHSHMLWYGVLAHDAGYDMMFHISWRDREIVMDILEELTGNRVNYSMMTIGGVRRDIDEDLRKKMIVRINDLKKTVLEHIDVMRSEKTFTERLENVGVLTRSDVIKMNAVGPTVRGSDVDFDLRRDLPYAAYKDIPFKVHYEKTGDVYASLLVRLNETLESVEMCEYILHNLPSGEINIRVPSRLPEGEAHSRVEAPRGEDIHYIRSIGGKAPDRHKVRAPTLANITSLLHRFRNMQVADIPLIIRLIDPCIGCMERVTFVDTQTLRSTVLTGSELLAKSKLKHLKGKEVKIFR
jgi:NADH-quinone oxidoreductase subunit D